MKFLILREDILTPLQMVNSVVDRRQNLPILSNVLIKLSADKFSLTTSDMEIEMVCEVNKKMEQTGEITLPARKFLDICRSLPESAELQFEKKEDRVLLKSGKSRFTLVAQPAEEFPETDIQNITTEFKIQQSIFKSILEDTMFAMAQQDVRYYLNGLLLEVSNNLLRAVATDGHRLALKETLVELNIGAERQIILPRKGVMELVKTVENNEQEMLVQIANNHIRFTMDNVVISSKLIDGKFPDYERVVPVDTSSPLIADRETLKQSLNRASILSNEKYRGVRVSIQEGSLKAQAQNPEQEEAEEEIDVKYTGNEMEIGFNVSYLLDAINAIKTEDVKILFYDANSSCLILSTDESTCKYVVMPMRL